MTQVGDILKPGNVIKPNGFLNYLDFVDADIYSVALLTRNDEWKVIVFDGEEPSSGFWDSYNLRGVSCKQGIVLQTRSSRVERLHPIDKDKIDRWEQIDAALEKYPVGAELSGCFRSWVVGEPTWESITGKNGRVKVPIRYEDGSGGYESVEYLDEHFRVIKQPE